MIVKQFSNLLARVSPICGIIYLGINYYIPSDSLSNICDGPQLWLVNIRKQRWFGIKKAKTWLSGSEQKFKKFIVFRMWINHEFAWNFEGAKIDDRIMSLSFSFSFHRNKTFLRHERHSKWAKFWLTKNVNIFKNTPEPPHSKKSKCVFLTSPITSQKRKHDIGATRPRCDALRLLPFQKDQFCPYWSRPLCSFINPISRGLFRSCCLGLDKGRGVGVANFKRPPS